MWYFSSRRTLAHKISHWQMRCSKSLTALTISSCTSADSATCFWLNDQNYTQYSGCNCTMDGIMLFPVLASVPFLTLLTLFLLFDSPWALAGVLKIFSLSVNIHFRAHHYVRVHAQLAFLFHFLHFFAFMEIKLIIYFNTQCYEIVLQVLTSSFNLIVWNKLSESFTNISESGKWLQNQRILRKNLWQFLFTFFRLDPFRWLFA